MPYSQIAQVTVASAPGIGVITMGSATPTFQTFAEVGVAAGELVPYALPDVGDAFESGHGVCVGDGTFTRSNIYRSSMPDGLSPIDATAAAILTLGPPSESAVGALQNNLYATQALAVAGVDNATIMTPLRTAQEIAALLPPPVYPFNIYSASTTIVVPSRATKAMVKLWGAGRGGGGYNSADLVSGDNGAPGGYLEKFLTGLVAGDTLSLVLGSAGVGGAPNSEGTNGGSAVLSSGTQTISTLTANGGSLAGGAATGGDINVSGSVYPAINNGPSAGGLGSNSNGGTGQNGSSPGCTIQWFA